jgi:hypothetical protein
VVVNYLILFEADVEKKNQTNKHTADKNDKSEPEEGARE